MAKVIISPAKELLAKIACTGISSISDINKKYRYEDTHNKGKGDSEKVSCGQHGDYNELEYIYKSKLESFIKQGKFSEADAIKALCETCSELDSPRMREDFYKLLGEKLKITIE